jgi:hypothetical protein
MESVFLQCFSRQQKDEQVPWSKFPSQYPALAFHSFPQMQQNSLVGANNDKRSSKRKSASMGGPFSLLCVVDQIGWCCHFDTRVTRLTVSSL